MYYNRDINQIWIFFKIFVEKVLVENTDNLFVILDSSH